MRKETFWGKAIRIVGSSLLTLVLFVFFVGVDSKAILFVLVGALVAAMVFEPKSLRSLWVSVGGSVLFILTRGNLKLLGGGVFFVTLANYAWIITRLVFFS